MRILMLAAAVVGLAFCTLHAHSADWTTFRGDASRSGYTAETLPDELNLRWTWTSPEPPQRAWPRSDRMTFDRALQAVAADGGVYFGSSVDGAVRAIDAASGELRWTFYTQGPIRFAPVVWRDRVLAASDDGHLYALDAADGHVVWKRRGGPDHSLRLGNERMISKWPARGGPAVVGDVVYFGAGIWPSDGIFLYALDAATGKVKWRNDESGRIYMAQPHGGANAESGVSSQGYLVASDAPATRPGGVEHRLFVPTGRAVPAAFDRDSGTFEYFHLQQFGRKGGASTMALGPRLFNSGMVFDVESGLATHTIGDGPLAAMPDGLVRAGGDSVSGYEWGEVETVDRKGNKVRGQRLMPLWTVDNVDARGELIVSGKRVIAGGAERVAVLDPANEEVVWSAEVEGVACGLAVSDGRLLVSTDAGHVYCFDSRPVERSTDVTPSEGAPPVSSDEAVAAAIEILRRADTLDGFCLDLGCGDAALTQALAERSQLHIIAVESDEEQAAEARARLTAVGLYGSRVTVLHVEELNDTGLPNYFANVIVSGQSLNSGESPAAKEAARLLHPYGGVMLVGKPSEMTLTRRGALEGAGEWTHQYTNPANTLCSTDELVQGALGMLWFRDVDVDMPQRHGRGPGPLFQQGRLYSEGLDELVCLDAYNGRTLWKYSLPGILSAYNGDELMGTAGTHSNYCVSPQGVFVRREGRCLRIDPVTGQPQGEFLAPKQVDGEPGVWGYIAVEDGVLYGTLADQEHVVTYRYVNRGGDMRQLLTESKTLFALDAETGELLWRYDVKDSLRHNAIAIGDRRVYLIDRPAALFDRDRTKKSGEHPPGRLVCLDGKSGEVVWTNERQIDGTLLALSTQHDTLLMSYQPTRFALASEVGGRLAAFDSGDGTLRWEKSARYSSRPLINDRTIYAQGGGWDLLTGDQRPFDFRRSYGCGVLAGSRNMMVFRSATLGYFDVNRQEKTENFGGARPGCWINAIPAGGLVLVPDASAGCSCSYLNQAWFALQPEEPRTGTKGSEKTEDER